MRRPALEVPMLTLSNGNSFSDGHSYCDAAKREPLLFQYASLGHPA